MFLVWSCEVRTENEQSDNDKQIKINALYKVLELKNKHFNNAGVSCIPFHNSNKKKLQIIGAQNVVTKKINQCVYNQLLLCFTKPSRNNHWIITLEILCCVEVQGCTVDSEKTTDPREKTQISLESVCCTSRVFTTLYMSSSAFFFFLFFSLLFPFFRK